MLCVFIHPWYKFFVTIGQFSYKKNPCSCIPRLIHWGRVTHKYVPTDAITVSDNGLSPGRRQAIIWNDAGILLIGLLGTNFNDIFIEIEIFSLANLHLKVSYAKRRPSCYSLGAVSIRKTVLPGMAIPMLKIRRPNGRLIFNMEIAIRR